MTHTDAHDATLREAITLLKNHSQAVLSFPLEQP